MGLLFVSLVFFWLGLSVASPLVPGVDLRVYYLGEALDELYPLVPGQLPNFFKRRKVIDYPDKGDFGRYQDHFIAEISGYLNIGKEGTYTFRLISDDGSSLKIEESLVILNDGVHAATTMDGSIHLSKGTHPFLVRFFEAEGDEVLKLKWKMPDSNTFQIVPSSAFVTQEVVDTSTSSGRKKIFYQGGKFRPGAGMPLVAVHPGYDLIAIRPKNFKPRVGGMDFLSNGHLVLSDFIRGKKNGKIYVLEGLDRDDPKKVRITKIADGLYEPLGIKVINDEIYVAQKHAITKLVDENRDGIIEERVVAQDWIANNFHHFTFGLLHKEGFLFATLSTAIDLNEPGVNGANPPNRGTIIKVDTVTGKVEYIAGGLRTPNGIAFGPENEIFVSDNQGSWLPSNKLNHIQSGHFYGHYNNPKGHRGPYDHKAFTPPALYLPHEGVTASPTQPLLISQGEYSGQMLLADLVHPEMKRVFLEKVNGVWQGALFRFTAGLECGINRMTWGPDRALYVGGLGDCSWPGWCYDGKEFGLQKLKPNRKTVFEMKAIRAVHQGFEIEYTKPISSHYLENEGNYRVRQWYYIPTVNYGGPRQGHEIIDVENAIASSDGKRVRLIMPELKRGRVVHIRADFPSIDGDKLWSTETWYTLNEKVE